MRITTKLPETDFKAELKRTFPETEGNERKTYYAIFIEQRQQEIHYLLKDGQISHISSNDIKLRRAKTRSNGQKISQRKI